MESAGLDHAHQRARPIRVGLVDDHPSVLAGVAGALRSTHDVRVVGTAGTVGAAVALAGEVDVLLCDMQLGGHAEGLEILARIHAGIVEASTPAVVILSGFDQPSLLRAAIDHGAVGYLPKTASVDEIVAAIRTVAVGGTAFSAEALRASRSARRRPSDRELQVIDLVRSGATNGEIAAALGLSEKTVESHLRRLFDRYVVLSRTELVVLAIDEGWTAQSWTAEGGRR